MHPTSVTVSIPVGDLTRATAWYDAVLARGPALQPVPGIVEYEFAGVWIQLASGQAGHAGWVLRYGVEDVHHERERLAALGVVSGDIETVPDVISFFDFRDPDGNELSCYQVLDGT